LSETAIVVRHAIRAALNPVLTVFGLSLGGILGGSVIVESVLGVKEVNNQIKVRQRGSAEESRSETETSGKQRKAS